MQITKSKYCSVSVTYIDRNLLLEWYSWWEEVGAKCIKDYPHYQTFPSYELLLVRNALIYSFPALVLPGLFAVFAVTTLLIMAQSGA